MLAHNFCLGKIQSNSAKLITDCDRPTVTSFRPVAARYFTRVYCKLM